MKVFVSVGHDAQKKGAKCTILNEYEYDILIPLTQYLMEELVGMKIDAVKVYSDVLGSAIEEVNRQCDGDSIAIETHFNNFKDSSVGGCETLYCKGSSKGKELAIDIQNSLLAHLQLKDRGLLERDNLAFLNDTKCPAVIVEPFFLSNKEEVKRFLKKDREANLRNIAFSIAVGIRDYVVRKNDQNLSQ